MAWITIKGPAAASCPVGTNLMAGHRLQIVPQIRRVSRIGVTGSAAAGDSAIDLFYGDTFLGTFYNTTLGANIIPLDSKDMMNVTSRYALDRNEPLNLLVSVAPTTNPLNVSMEISEF